MRCSDVHRWLGRLLVVYVFVVLGLPGASFGKDAAGGSPLSMTDIVKQATQQSAAGHRIVKLTNGHARVPSPVQAIEAVAAPEGITVSSTRKDKPGSFAIRADTLGRTGSNVAPITPGAVSVDKERARIVHPGLTEELTTSAEGVRQDFLVPAPLQGKGELALELSFSGAELHQSGEEVELSLPEGRKFLYRRLQVSDKNGTTLPARFEVQGANRLRIVVADAGAVYPVRIDPTITDANWISIEVPGTNGYVRALLFAGGNLYAGGSFTAIGGSVANYVARWDGSSWSALGSGIEHGLYGSPTIYALAWDGANLYAGGDFYTAGGNSANNIVKWDGSSWSALGSGVGGEFPYVSALAWDGANLYAGGDFITAGGNSANHIARWNGSSWSPLGSGVNGWVRSLAWDGANLYAGGQFSIAGGNNVNSIAKWNGSSWSALGSGMGGGTPAVYSLTWDGANLYAGGSFTTAGGTSANNIAKWEGSTWSALGSGISGGVVSLAWDGAHLYAGGSFTTAGGGSAICIAKWEGSYWSSLSSGLDRAHDIPAVYALAWDGVNLYAGGSFTTAGGNSANYIARWDGSSWSAPWGGMVGYVTALAWDGANLYAGGYFTITGVNGANSIAKWNGSSWSPLGSGMNGAVNALAWDGANLYAGGQFSSAGGDSANNIAKWNGSSWSPLGSGMNDAVFALVWGGANLYAGGQFYTAGGYSVSNIAKWDGSSWSALGSGLNREVEALAWDGTNLYAGGYFYISEVGSFNHIAKWDGTSWSALGSGVDYAVTALVWDGANLYAGGWFITPGVHVAKWNGSSWLGMGGINGFVNALVWDGANLYAGGQFSIAGGNSANNIAKWDGNSWSALGSGMNDAVFTLAWNGANLYAGGGFYTAGGKPGIVTCLATVPGAPTIGTAIAGNAHATVSFAVSASNGCAAITSYTVTSNPGNITASGSTSPITVTGLSNGMTYVFTVTATNIIGESVPSVPSNSVMPLAVSVKKNTATVSYKGGKGTIAFTAAGDTASAPLDISSSASWLTFTQSEPITMKKDKGSGRIIWSAEPNPASMERSAIISIDGQIVTITQFAAPCVVKLAPTSISETDNSGGAATITVTAPDACGWEVSSGTATWINPTPLSGFGAGTITLEIAANTTGKSRSGKVTVATEAKSGSVTVKQPK